MKKEDIDFIAKLLTEAGTVLREEFKKQQIESDMREIMKKFRQLNGTITEIIQTGLASRFPDVGWSDDEFNIAKQHQTDIKGDYWVTDPLDGGVNFMQAFRPWAITLTKISNALPVFAVIYDPMAGELFYAIENGGAYLNHAPIKVSDKRQLNFALMGTAFPNNMLKEVEQTSETLGLMQSLSKKIFAFRILGPASVQLAYLACGRIDGYVECGEDIYDWLAGALIAKEAGAEINAIDGTTFGFGKTGIIASNGFLHHELLEAIKN